MWTDDFDSGELDDDDESQRWDLGNLTDSALASIGEASCPPKWKKIEEYQTAYDFFVGTMYVLVEDFGDNYELSELEEVKLEDAITAGFEAIHLSNKVGENYPADKLASEQKELHEKMKDVLSIKKRFAESAGEGGEHQLLETALSVGIDVDRIKHLKTLMNTYSAVARNLSEVYGKILQHYHTFDSDPEHKITFSQLDDFKGAIQLARNAIELAGELDGMQAGDEWPAERKSLISMFRLIRHAYNAIIQTPDKELIFDDDFYHNLELREDE